MNINNTEILEKLQKVSGHTNSNSHCKNKKAGKGQSRVLAILLMKPTISQRELTFLLDISKQALAELLSKMEHKGYIVKTPSTQDKRVMMIELSEEGRSVAQEIEDEPNQYDYLFDHLDESELETLNSLLDTMIQNIDVKFPDAKFEEKREAREEFKRKHQRMHKGHCHGNHERHHEECCKGQKNQACEHHN